MSSVHTEVSSSLDAQSSFEHEPCGGWMLRRTEEEQWSDTESVRLCCPTKEDTQQESTEETGCPFDFFPLLDFGVLRVEKL